MSLSKTVLCVTATLLRVEWMLLPIYSLKKLPVRLLGTRFTIAIYCFEPGSQEPYRDYSCKDHATTDEIMAVMHQSVTSSNEMTYFGNFFLYFCNLF
jgi:hypothetical protein